jgi:hypothetical protein
VLQKLIALLDDNELLIPTDDDDAPFVIVLELELLPELEDTPLLELLELHALLDDEKTSPELELPISPLLELPENPSLLDDAVSQININVPPAAEHISAGTSTQAPLTWQKTLLCCSAELLQ